MRGVDGILEPQSSGCCVPGGVACRFGEPCMNRTIKYTFYLSRRALWISFLSTHY